MFSLIFYFKFNSDDKQNIFEENIMLIGLISDTHIPDRARQIPEKVLQSFVKYCHLNEIMI